MSVSLFFPKFKVGSPFYWKKSYKKIGTLSENVSQTRERMDELHSVIQTFGVLNFLEFRQVLISITLTDFKCQAYVQRENSRLHSKLGLNKVDVHKGER